MSDPREAQEVRAALAAEPPSATSARGSFLTRESAIEKARARLGRDPTEQQIAAWIDAYASLFGDMVAAHDCRCADALAAILSIAEDDRRGWSHWDRVAQICRAALGAPDA